MAPRVAAMRGQARAMGWGRLDLDRATFGLCTARGASVWSAGFLTASSGSMRGLSSLRLFCACKDSSGGAALS
jgi:hypothetical protein